MKGSGICFSLLYKYNLSIRTFLKFRYSKRIFLVSVTNRPRVSYYFFFRASNRANRSSALQSQKAEPCRNLSKSKNSSENFSTQTNERKITHLKASFSKENKVSVSVTFTNLNEETLMDLYKCRVRYSIP